MAGKEIPLSGISSLECGACRAEFNYRAPTLAALERIVVEHFEREHPEIVKPKPRRKS